MADYELRLQTVNGAYLATIPFANLQGEMRKNEPCEFRWTTPLSAITDRMNPVDLIAGVTEVGIFRNNTRIFTGPIWDIDCNSKDKLLKMTAQDVSSYLTVRRISADAYYKNWTYGATAWDLISDLQALSDGSFNITLGTQVPGNAPKGTTRYTKKSGTNVWKAIDKLATATNGFDWEINAARAFNAYWPRIQSVSRIKLEYGSSIKNYSIQNMGKLLATDTFIRGGSGLVSNSLYDQPARTAYRRRQYVESKTTLKSKSKLNSYALYQLNLRKAPKFIPQLTVNSNLVNPFDGDIDFGYVAKVIIDDGWVQYNGDMRCSGYQVTVGKHGQETFVLYMNDLREIAAQE